METVSIVKINLFHYSFLFLSSAETFLSRVIEEVLYISNTKSFEITLINFILFSFPSTAINTQGKDNFVSETVNSLQLNSFS